MIASPIDTYLQYVMQQMVVIGAQVTINGQSVAQPFGGITQARDWPQTPVNEGSLYLLVLDQVPHGGTASQRGYEYFLQWAWMLIGQDVQSTQQAANRGDRYRQNLVIEENLRQANYPGFCQKKDLVADSQGNLGFAASYSILPPNAYEPLYWTELRFKPKDDAAQSGVLYGAAAIELYAYSDVSPLVA
jgi:hypothetical protein